MCIFFNELDKPYSKSRKNQIFMKNMVVPLPYMIYVIFIILLQLPNGVSWKFILHIHQ